MNAIFCLNCGAAKTDHSSVLSLCKMFQYAVSLCCALIFLALTMQFVQKNAW